MLFFKYSAVQLLKYSAVQVLKYSMAQLCAVPAPTQGFPAGFPLDSSGGHYNYNYNYNTHDRPLDANFLVDVLQAHAVQCKVV